MERLTAKRAETLRKPGRYRVGDTVYLVVARGRKGQVNKRWVQRLHVQGKRRDISIGTYPAVTLSEARERAHDNRLTAKRGGDPSGRASTVPTFAAVSAKVERGGPSRRPPRETSRVDGRLGGVRRRREGRVMRRQRSRRPAAPESPRPSRRLRLHPVLVFASSSGLGSAVHSPADERRASPRMECHRAVSCQP